MRVQTGQESSGFRKPTPPPPDRATQRRGPEARSDRSVVIPARVASSLSRTVREQLAYLTPDQQRAFLWRYRAQAKSPVVALAFLPRGGRMRVVIDGIERAVWLAFDGNRPGDEEAQRFAERLPRTRRLRPPDRCKDWSTALEKRGPAAVSRWVRERT